MESTHNLETSDIEIERVQKEMSNLLRRQAEMSGKLQELQKINQFIDQGNYQDAADTIGMIDCKRIRSVRTLCWFSDIYEAAGRLEEGKELLLFAYKRSSGSKAVLKRLIEVTIKLAEFDEALLFYSEYVGKAPNDNNRFLMKYKIYRGKGASVEEQIEILREYLSQEYNEKYVYELAKLYQQADRIADCLAQCDDLILWFQSGDYVLKALELKQRYVKLSPKQKELFERERNRMKPGAVMEQSKQPDPELIADETDNIPEFVFEE